MLTTSLHELLNSEFRVIYIFIIYLLEAARIKLDIVFFTFSLIVLLCLRFSLFDF